MRYPKHIKANDTLGFVSPSFGCGIEPYISAFANAIKKFQEIGYKTDVGYNCRKTDGIGRSTNAGDCAKEFMEYYLSNENQALISCGGGELMCEILNFMDFEKISQAEPKWFMGYSDNTHMTFLLPTICDVAAVYGPCAAAFGMEPWHKAIDDAFGVLEGRTKAVENYSEWELNSLKSGENPLAPYNTTEKVRLKIYSPPDEAGLSERQGNTGSTAKLSERLGETGSAAKLSERLGETDSAAELSERLKETDGEVRFSGRLIGGCLDCLINMAGTKFDRVKEFAEKYSDDGIIWFMESCDLNVMAIRRAMWQLDACGWFSNVKGFIIGRPYCMAEEPENGASMMGLNQYEAVLGVVGKYNVPVIMDADIGHLSPMMPIVAGSVAEVCAVGNSLKINMKYM